MAEENVEIHCLQMLWLRWEISSPSSWESSGLCCHCAHRARTMLQIRAEDLLRFCHPYLTGVRPLSSLSVDSSPLNTSILCWFNFQKIKYSCEREKFPARWAHFMGTLFPRSSVFCHPGAVNKKDKTLGIMAGFNKRSISCTSNRRDSIILITSYFY